MKFSKENNLVILLYEEPSSKTLDLREIKRYLKHKLGDIDIGLRKEFFAFHLNSEEIDKYAEKLARCRVRNLLNPNEEFSPLPGEIRYERELLEHPERRLTGVLYDGYQLDVVFQDLIPRDELGFNHIVFTNRLFGTFDENDLRYHARVIICGYPSLISTTGIVEAPAKPREFYYLKQRYLPTQIPIEIIKEKLKGRFIDYDDPRLTEVMKGYVMQSIFYHFTLKPFCENKKCRLYNAHWQEEVINAQLTEREFCEEHERILRNLKR